MKEEIKTNEKTLDDTNQESQAGEKKNFFKLNVKKIKDNVDKAAQAVNDAAQDVGDFANDQFNNAKTIFGKVSKNIEESLSKQRLEQYRPIFPDKFDPNTFEFPSMINVVEFDKRMGIEECQGAIGYREKINNVEVLGIYKSSMDDYGIQFYPEKIETAYYVHPLQKNAYIEVSEYFKYLKQARVAELEYIAQSLGAKHFVVSIMEESSTEQIKKDKGEAKLKLGKDSGNAAVEVESKEKKFEFLGIAAENSYPGKAPVKPVLHFWANNESIKSLVEQRMNPENPLLSKTYRLDYNTCTGIKEKEAAKIDGVLKALKFKGAGSISEEAKNESKRRFEYKIEF